MIVYMKYLYYFYPPMRDDRENIKVQPGVRRLVKLVAAHLGKTQSDVIKEWAEIKCKELEIPIK